MLDTHHIWIMLPLAVQLIGLMFRNPIIYIFMRLMCQKLLLAIMNVTNLICQVGVPVDQEYHKECCSIDVAIDVTVYLVFLVAG